MKTFRLLVLFNVLAALAGLLTVSAFAEKEPAWQTAKSDHFVAYYAGNDRGFTDEVLKKAEIYYEEIAAWLGYSRRDAFWTWDSRCRIYIYASKNDYLAQTGQPAWSGGAAVLDQRMLLSFQEAPDFLNSVLPHELAHLIFRDFVGDRNAKVPLWLDEGVAMAQEKLKRPEFDAWIARMSTEKKWIEMDDFMKVQSLQHISPNQAALFYAQAQSIVRFLVDDFGSARFAGFCRSLRDHDSPEAALQENYPKIFPTLAAFETKWEEYAGHPKNAGGASL